MRKITLLLIVLFLTGFVLMPCQSEAKASKDQMINNAENALKAGGVDLTSVNLIYDDGNTFWQERIAYIEQDTSQNHGILPHGILKNKEYQVIYFDFVESSPIGDTWLFMDPDTGDVIGIYEERQ
ncbi:MAG: hypothetical protein U9R44_03295 [Candidatus Omnitrophota bacterium]|nr:hypothetical protein [Candidatus Omnitrophota bacterium]